MMKNALSVGLSATMLVVAGKALALAPLEVAERSKATEVDAQVLEMIENSLRSYSVADAIRSSRDHLLLAQSEDSVGSMPGQVACYTNCYGNCYFNCYSRSWR